MVNGPYLLACLGQRPQPDGDLITAMWLQISLPQLRMLGVTANQLSIDLPGRPGCSVYNWMHPSWPSRAFNSLRSRASL